MNKPIDPVLPFIWPEPLVSAGFNTYVTDLPFDVAVRSAVSVDDGQFIGRWHRLS
jgi:hypothetical protein